MLQELDFWFPFVVFFYGLLVVGALACINGQLPLKHSALGMQLSGKEPFAWICLIIGALWSAQNLLLS